MKKSTHSNISHDILLNDISLIITDTNNHITFVSDKFKKIMGYTDDEILGQSPSILKHPSASRYILDDIWNSLNSNKYWQGMLKNIKKNGEIIYLNAEIYMDFDEFGNHIGYHAIQTDITSSIKDPHKFIFDNELFHLFFSDQDELIIITVNNSITHAKHIIFEISSKLEKLLGFSKEYFSKNQLLFTDILDKKCKYYKNFDLLISDYQNNNIDCITIKDVNKNIRTCRLSITPFEYNKNQSLIFKMIDISQELEYSKQLNEINIAKNNFLANFSHEIRTPLNATIGFLNLLHMRETNKEKLDYINIILDSTTHLLDLMNDVIDFTSIDNKKLEIVSREFTPKDIQSTIEIFYAKSLEKGIEFTAFISPQLPDIMEQDILRLKQVISNLLSNAIKFADKNGKISTEVHFHNDTLYLTVEDDGIGMTENQIKRIFKPFSQANRNTQLFYGGNGLGLSVVKDIIELMGGSISVKSEPEKGAKFSLEIPAKAIKYKKIEGKLNIDNIYIFTPSFSEYKVDIISKYLMHFTSANINIVNNLDNIENSVIFLYLDDCDCKTIKLLSKSNKIIILKTLNDISQEFDNNKNIMEINMPIMGSKIFDALNGLLNGIHLKNLPNNTLDLNISANILVADDLESNRILIKELLSKYNIKITLVENGKEAIEAYKKSVKNNKSYFDVIILDMNMPIVSGSRAASTIRSFENQHKINRTPIIALTANRYNTIDDKSLVNLDEYVSKPINLKHLLSVIIKHTSNILLDNIENNNKIMKLKEIRDSFLNGSKDIKKLIIMSKDIFEANEYSLLLDILTIKNDKRKFNLKYNNLIKLIRKNINRINNKNKGD